MVPVFIWRETMKKKSIYELLLARAAFSYEMYFAILTLDEEYVQKYLDEYDNNDRMKYDFSQERDMTILWLALPTCQEVK